MTKADQIRDAALTDLPTFINLIHPDRMLGHVHRELCRWWDREDRRSHQLTLLPRDHQKSAMLAYRVAQRIIRNPAVRILYISSTSNLARQQLGFIKKILTSPVVARYWPELLHPEEGKREKWTETEIAVDHPRRKAENVRDPTIWIAGLTTNIVGMHCDITCMDDVVTAENAYTAEGREKVKTQYSYLSSIESTGAEGWVVGTRYDPNDLYNEMLNARITMYKQDGELLSEDPLYEVFEKQVESQGDGTGEYIWPKQQRKDGRWFGFDQAELAKKRAGYLDKAAFRAQYYNDPNDVGGGGIPRDRFQYYDKDKVTRFDGKWYFQGKRLNVFASVDFAYSLRADADYTCVCVIGVDPEHNYYVLDIDRFKTKLPSVYFEHILALHQKWDFRKIRAEVTAAQASIVEGLKHDYIRPHGLALFIEEARPNRNQGTKEERIQAILEAKYMNGQIWHYQGGSCQILEDELIQLRPAHDDVKDALASAIETAVAPAQGMGRTHKPTLRLVHSKFGGIA